ncbi:MAG: transporter substrate-binding domain-containing protein [Defluviitaleaceae bacterium]|nr:transporter substrate-binding domain-containing protein [Defluviitaleaceae bacterium]
MNLMIPKQFLINKHQEFAKRFVALLLLCAMLLGITSCVSELDAPVSGAVMESIQSFRDIPGITEREIAGVEALKASRQSISFWKTHSAEWFVRPDGTYAGFLPLLNNLMSDLFEIPFVIEFHDWNSIIDGIDSGAIDFTSEYGITPERQNRYYMSDPIAQRSLSILTYGDRRIEATNNLNGLRVGMFLEGSAVAQTVASAYPELEFETVTISDVTMEADMLRNGEIDAVIGISARMNYEYTGVEGFTLANGLLPLAYTSAALTTAKAELEPIISIMNKYIAAGGISKLYELYRQGNDEYNRYLLYNSFSDEERAYIDNLTASVPIVLGTDTYPVSFYNVNEGEFQGISMDILKEISRMTGIEFEPVNGMDASWGEILEMLRMGEAALISDLIITEERKEYFIWPETPFFSTPYAFFSKVNYPNLELNQIGQASVGVVGWCATRQIYEQWFPNYSNAKHFDSQDDALDALENSEIDLFFNLGYILYYQQNYREKPGYKANYTFPVFNDTFFGLNKNEDILCSIIDKTLVYVNTEKISNEWTNRSFDYSRMLAEEQLRHANQRVLIVSVSTAALLLLMLIVVLLLLKINKTRKMAMDVEQEAHERFSIMLDSNPLCCKLWSNEYKLLDCNQAAASMCGFQTKQEYLAGYFNLDPEFQPDGQRSDTKRAELLKRAFEGEGILNFEWLHMLPDGIPMPAEITLVKVKYGTEYVVAGYTRDLREEKRMIQELKEAQATTLKILDTNPQINVLFDSNFNIVECNLAAIRFMGFETKEELIAGFYERFTKSLPEIQPDGRVTIPMPERFKTATKEGYNRVETELHMGGMTKNLLIEMVRIPYGSSFAIIVYAYDMTEMRSREKELIKAREVNELQLAKLNLIIEAAKIGMFNMEINPSDPLNLSSQTEYSAEYRELLGFTDDDQSPENLGDSRIGLVHPDDTESAFSTFSAHLLDKTGNTPFDIEQRLKKKNGEYACFRTVGKAIRDKDGNPVRFVSAAFDMTEIRKREQELIQTHEMNEMQLAKISLINKAARIGLWDMEIIRDDPTNIRSEVTYTAEFREIFGYTDEHDFPNSLESFSNCLDPDALQIMNDKLTAHLADPTGKTPFDPEYQAKKKNGDYIYIRATGESIRDEQGNAIRTVGTMMDVTEEKNYLVNTERLRQQAEEANKAKSTFLANMSHEIRTPLNAVIGLSGLILNTDNELNEESRYRLDRINNAGATLLNTVNDILDISKIEAGKFELIPSIYDIPSMINDAVTQSILHRGEKSIEFVMNVCANLPTQLYGDELRIKQILNNLLSNAFKYTTEGTVELTVSCVREGDCIWLTFIIRDTGIGIRQEDMVNLFSDYVQADMSANRKIVGTGLGLSIAKRLVELMDGQITAESEYGKGSVFTVRLMQKYVTDNAIGPKAVESLKNLNYSAQKQRRFGEMSRISLPYARVLIVDDVETNLDVAKGLMKSYSMKIDCVTSGQEAIEAMMDSRVRYNAVFMDHMMPGMDGIEATRRIREIGTDYTDSVPIIALTANAIVGNEEMFLQNGFQAFISKPIEIAHLDAVIREWVRDKEQEKLHQHIEEQNPPAQNNEKNWQAMDKGIPGINTKKGLSRFNGDKDAYLDVLRSYAKNTPRLLEGSGQVTSDLLADYATIVHGIKGSSGGICAEETAGIAEALEGAALAGDYEYVAAHNENLTTTARRLISGITTMLERFDADNLKPKKEKLDNETLDRLRQACIDYEMSGVDAALGELEAFDYKTDGELIVWLRENAEQMNFDEIVKRISDTIE